VIIVVIHWKIRPDEASIRQFREKWRDMRPPHLSNFVGEYLSDPLSEDEVGFPCTTFNASASVKYRSFFNIGIWKDIDAFKTDVIASFVVGAADLQPFEFDHRERMVLAPFNWRAGEDVLPRTDHLD
jgi:hypothetical protein